MATEREEVRMIDGGRRKGAVMRRGGKQTVWSEERGRRSKVKDSRMREKKGGEGEKSGGEREGNEGAQDGRKGCEIKWQLVGGEGERR